MAARAARLRRGRSSAAAWSAPASPRCSPRDERLAAWRVAIVEPQRAARAARTVPWTCASPRCRAPRERILAHAGAWRRIEADACAVLGHGGVGRREPPRRARRPALLGGRDRRARPRLHRREPARAVGAARVAAPARRDAAARRARGARVRRRRARGSRSPTGAAISCALRGRRGRRTVAHARAVRHRPRRLDLRPDRGRGAPAHRAAAPRYRVAALPARRTARLAAAARRARVAGLDDDAGGGRGTAGARARCVLAVASPRPATGCSAASSSTAAAPACRSRCGTRASTCARASRSSATRRTRSIRWRGRASTSGSSTAPRWCEVLGDAVAAGADPFGLRTLRRYERWRRSENALMLGASDTLNGLFGEKSVVVAARATARHGRWSPPAVAAPRARAAGARARGRPARHRHSPGVAIMTDHELAAGPVHAGRAGARQPVPRRSAARRLAAPRAAGRRAARRSSPNSTNSAHSPAASCTACSSPTGSNEPRLLQWDAWGNRIDRSRCRRCGARRSGWPCGTGSSPRPTSGRSAGTRRIAQFAKVYLFHPVVRRLHLPARDDRRCGAHAARFGQPRADRARRAAPDVARSGHVLDQRPVDDRDHRRLRRRPLARRAPSQDDGRWRLYGRKWFTSAVTSQMALTLARPEGNPPGGKGLAMFYVEVRDARGAAQRHPRRPPQGQARHPQGADRRADARRHAAPSWSGEPVERHARHRADARRDAHVEQRLRGRVHAPRPRARALLRRAARGVRRAARCSQPLHADTLAALEAETWGAFLMTFLLVELHGRAETRRDRRPSSARCCGC